jgi:hypothetical protein
VTLPEIYAAKLKEQGDALDMWLRWTDKACIYNVSGKVKVKLSLCFK